MAPKLAIPGASLHQAQSRLRRVGFGFPRLLIDGANAATSVRAAIAATGSATPHTMGAWVEVVAALSEDVGFVKITPTAGSFTNTVDSSALLNLGVGAAASEVVVLDSLGVGWWTGSAPLSHPGWVFPLFIAKGSRVAFQVQGAEVSKSITMRFEFFAPIHGLRPSPNVVALGAVVASSRGAVVATPGGANTYGAWTEIVAATAEPYSALGVSVQGGSDIAHAGGSGLLDIGVGAAGNEVAMVPALALTLNVSEAVSPLCPLVHPVTVPAGARLVARWQTTNVGNSIDVILHGIRAAA